MNAPIQFSFRPSIVASLMAAAMFATSSAQAADAPPPAAEENAAPAAGVGAPALDLEGAEKMEVMHSMIGITTTRVFYTVPAHSAVVTVSFDNTKPDFPASVTVNLFAPGTSAEDIGKWLNNQHSDALFGDAPSPVLTETLPEGSVVVGEKKRVGKLSNPGPHGGEYFKNDVAFSIKEFKNAEGKFILKRFKDKTKVHEKAGE